MSVHLGDPAPDFELRDQHGAGVRLSSLRGRPALVVFYPFAFSRVCGGELTALRDGLPGLVPADVALIAVSCDPVFALRAFADQERIAYPLLSDFWPHGAVADAYGVLDADRGCAGRSTFLVDRDGVLRWEVHNPMGEARDLSDYAAALAAIEAK